MLANLTLDQWFIAGLALAVVIGLLLRSFRTILALGLFWTLFYWPLMFAGVLIGDATEKFERDTSAETGSLTPSPDSGIYTK